MTPHATSLVKVPIQDIQVCIVTHSATSLVSNTFYNLHERIVPPHATSLVKIPIQDIQVYVVTHSATSHVTNTFYKLHERIVTHTATSGFGLKLQFNTSNKDAA